MAFNKSLANYEFTFSARIDASTTKLIKILDRIDQGVRKAAAATQRFAQTSQKSATSFSKYTTGADSVVGRLSSMVGGSKAAGAASSALSGLLGGGSKAFGAYGMAISAAIAILKKFIAAVGAVYDQIMKIAAPFERISAEVRVLAKASGSSEEDVAGLMRKIEELGASTEKTSVEVAQAARSILRAGEDAAGATNQLEASLSAAIATGENVDKVFGIGSTALSKFGENLGNVSIGGDKLRTALAVIAAGANSAKTNFVELGRAFSGNTGQLQTMQVSLLDAVTAMGILADNGLKGNKAMRLLNSNLSNLAANKLAKRTLEDLGVSISDASGQFKNIAVIAQDLQDALDLKTPAEQAQVLADLFGKNYTAMQALISAGLEGFTQLSEQISGATGMLSELESAQKRTMEGVKKQFESARQALVIKIGRIFSPAIIKFWKSAADAVNAFAQRVGEMAERIETRMKELVSQGKDELDAWISALREQNFGDLWENFAETAKPAIETITKLLLEGLLQAIKFFGQSFARALPEVGKILANALWTGLKQLPGLLVTLVKTVAGVIIETITGPFRRIINWIRGKESEALKGMEVPAETKVPKMPEGPEAGPEAKPAPLEPEIVDWEKREEEIQALKTRQLKGQIDLTSKTRQYNETLSKSATLMHKVQLSIIESGKKFSLWLLEPINQFNAKILSIREKFQDITAALREKVIGVGEKFGLITGEEATEKRRALLKQRLETTTKMLDLAQTAEERQRLQGRLGEYAEQLAGLGGPKQKERAKQAQKYFMEAEKSALEREKLELSRVGIEKRATLAAIPELEAQRRGARGQELVLVLQKLQESYKSFGKEGILKAQRLQEQLNKAQISAAKEQYEIMQQQLQYQKQQVEELRGVNESLKQQIAMGQAGGGPPSQPVIMSE